jgi:uncharacterized OsmC-like protein
MAELNGVDIDALKGTLEDCKRDPALARFEFRVRNRWAGGGANQSTVDGFFGAGEERTSSSRPFQLSSDEPEVLLGNDRAAGPVEHLLHALAACLTTSMVYHATARGMRLEVVESELQGELDLRGFLGLGGDGIRPGYRSVSVRFRVRGDGTPEQLRSLCEFSPVFDVVAHGTAVQVEIDKVERPADELGQSQASPAHA